MYSIDQVVYMSGLDGPGHRKIASSFAYVSETLVVFLSEPVEHNDSMAKPDMRGGQARPRYDACAVNKDVVQLHSYQCGRGTWPVA